MAFVPWQNSLISVTSPSRHRPEGALWKGNTTLKWKFARGWPMTSYSWIGPCTAVAMW